MPLDGVSNFANTPREEVVAVRPVLLVSTAESLRVAAITGVGVVPVPDWVVADALAAGRPCFGPSAQMPPVGRAEPARRGSEALSVA
jgi:DNA-binding transcriptional LysR family regulator